MNIDLIIQVLIFLYPSLFLLYQLFLYRLASRVKQISASSSLNKYSFLSIIVPTKGEDILIIQELIDNISQLEWDKRNMEVIIVSDDSEQYFEELLEKLKIPENLNVKLYRREKKQGHKSGALLYGYEKSKGDIIFIMDVDSRLPKDALIRAYNKMLTSGCDAVALQWTGYSKNKHSKLAKGIMASTLFGVKALFNGKENANLVIFPVGSGTLFKREALQAVGGWDYRLIQDDLEIGTRLVNKGKKICSSDVPIEIEVPDNFFSFYVQQTRWAMGTAEVLRHRIGYIITSKISVIKKIDMIIHLLQYTTAISMFLGSLLLIVLAPFIGNNDVLRSPLFLFWVIILALYAYIIYNISLKLGFSKKDALFSMGRLSAFYAAISPFILYSFLKGLLSKKKTYIVTPKGGSKAGIQYKVITIIGIFGIAYLLSAIRYLLGHDYVTALWLAYYSAGYLYTSLTFKREL